jgi:hypothetical protein
MINQQFCDRERINKALSESKELIRQFLDLAPVEYY